MYLSHLSLSSFRNFSQLELDLPPGVVVIYGANAQGKSSLLEAIYLLSVARSLLAETELELISWDAVGEGGLALVGGTIEKREERLRVFVGYRCVPSARAAVQAEDGGRSFAVRREIRVSRIKRTAAQLVGLVNAVLFTADDIELVQGPPSLRRRYLDILISQVDPPYLGALQRYQKVLAQRNRLLKSVQEGRSRDDELAFWDGELTKEGSMIVRRRFHAIEVLGPLCRERHAELTGGAEDLTMQYRPSVPCPGAIVGAENSEGEMENAFVAALQVSRRRELAQGSTVVGPHRDDFRLQVGGVDMRTYASRGQARTLALTLRLAEAAYVESARDESPIVLLDDVLSEMDSSRRARVLERILRYQQVIITTTDVEPSWRTALPGAAYRRVEAGRIVEIVPEALFDAPNHERDRSA